MISLISLTISKINIEECKHVYLIFTRDDISHYQLIEIEDDHLCRKQQV